MQKSQTATIQSQQNALAAAILLAGAIDAAPPPALSGNSAKPTDGLGAQFGGAQAASAPSPASFFTAPQPVQPGLQTWLDNWLGPRGRAGAPEESRSDLQILDQDDSRELNTPGSGWPNIPSDIPETPFSEPLTPEQITQRYEDVNAWLNANPGIEQGIAGASGALPERNPFMLIGAGFTGDSGFASMSGFWQTPGMAALDGHALKPLQGINEGYTLLGIT